MLAPPNSQPNQISSLDTLKKLLRLTSIAVSIGTSILLAKRLLSKPSPAKYYTDWTAQTISLTSRQKALLSIFLHTIDDLALPCVIITGDTESDIEELISKISNKNNILNNTSFSDTAVWSIDADSINGSGIVGQTAKRLKSIWDAAKKHHEKTGQKVILFFNEFHRFMQMDNHNVGEILRSLISNTGNFCGVHIVGATSKAQYNRYIAPEITLARRLPEHPLLPLTQHKSIKRALLKQVITIDRILEKQGLPTDLSHLIISMSEYPSIMTNFKHYQKAGAMLE